MMMETTPTPPSLWKRLQITIKLRMRPFQLELRSTPRGLPPRNEVVEAQAGPIEFFIIEVVLLTSSSSLVGSKKGLDSPSTLFEPPNKIARISVLKPEVIEKLNFEFHHSVSHLNIMENLISNNPLGGAP